MCVVNAYFRALLKKTILIKEILYDEKGSVRVSVPKLALEIKNVLQFSTEPGEGHASFIF